MAAQFGRWNLDGALVSPAFPDRVGERLTPWGPEGQFRYRDQHAELLWFSFETTEGHPAKQPMVLDSGEVLLWDGRLDNGPEILDALGVALSPPVSELDVVAAAWSAWGEDCLARFVGDWALSLWIPRSRRLLLAADILATRHLCYAVNKNQVLWSSVPDPLILLPGRNPELDDEYLAGWLGSFPAAHLTPFRDIRRVPPASIVTIRPDSVNIRRYWDFDGTRRIRYARDAEYEEHFLELFRQSVRRRLRSSSPILAELSGGMDSSAIVCVADQLTSAVHASKIDTVSWYNDTEPHWNERPWFTKVEAQRAKSGLHIEVNAIPASPVTEGAELWYRPGAAESESPMFDFMVNRGSRVLLSGIGGDEFLGGVPTPLPELEDLFARGKFFSLWRRNMAWALVQQRPWFHLLRETLRGFVPASPGAFNSRRQIPWLLPAFISRQSFALGGYRRRLRCTGALPSFQENVHAIEGIRRQLGCVDPSPGHPFERRYPFLDRNLLEFLFAISREQLVRPGQRRSLMRRALRGIVPDAILDRRRKAFITRSPIRKAEQHLRTLASSGRLASEDAGIVDSAQYRSALHAACAGSEVPMMALLRTMALEQWLEALRRNGFVGGRFLSNSSGVASELSGNVRIQERRENSAVVECRV